MITDFIDTETKRHKLEKAICNRIRENCLDKNVGFTYFNYDYLDDLLTIELVPYLEGDKCRDSIRRINEFFEANAKVIYHINGSIILEYKLMR